jgi:hypothetical protein
MSCLKLVVAERGSVDNANAGNPILFLVFVVLSIVAIVGGKPAKWKLYNLLIILGGCAFGTGFGALPMAFGGSAAISGHLAASFMVIFGAAAAYICLRRNSIRAKASARPDPVVPDGPAK